MLLRLGLHHHSGCPQTVPLCRARAESVGMAATFATTWCHGCCSPAHPAGNELGNQCLHDKGPGQPPCTSWWEESFRCSEKESKWRRRILKKTVTGWGTGSRKSAVWSRRALNRRIEFNSWFSSTILLQYCPTLSKNIPLFDQLGLILGLLTTTPALPYILHP